MRIHTHVTLPRSPAEAFDFLVSPLAFEMFVGYGPVPAIQRIDWSGSSDVVGSTGVVHSSDGNTHRETVTVVDRPGVDRPSVDRPGVDGAGVYEVKIDKFTSPFRFLTHGAVETWTLTQDGQSTHIDRLFVFSLKSPLAWPVARIMKSVMKRAIQKNHELFVAHFRARG